jgi:hypothetical protein
VDVIGYESIYKVYEGTTFIAGTATSR